MARGLAAVQEPLLPREVVQQMCLQAVYEALGDDVGMAAFRREAIHAPGMHRRALLCGQIRGGCVGCGCLTRFDSEPGGRVGPMVQSLRRALEVGRTLAGCWARSDRVAE